VEQKIDSVSAEVILKIPEIPANYKKIIYLFYGNPDAPVVANLKNALNWYDSFTENSTLVYNINQGGNESYSIGNGYLNIDDNPRTYNKNWAIFSPKNLLLPQNMSLKVKASFGQGWRRNILRWGKTADNYFEMALGSRYNYNSAPVNDYLEITEVTQGQRKLLNNFVVPNEKIRLMEIKQLANELNFTAFDEANLVLAQFKYETAALYSGNIEFGADDTERYNLSFDYVRARALAIIDPVLTLKQ